MVLQQPRLIESLALPIYMTLIYVVQMPLSILSLVMMVSPYMIYIPTMKNIMRQMVGKTQMAQVITTVGTAE